MRFRFGGNSKLYGRQVRMPMSRFSVAIDDGMTEYIFVYDKIRVPNESEEPDLYRDAKVKKTDAANIELEYDSLDEMVILLTEREDDAFRRGHPETVPKCERFLIEES
jgi:hypothetical protein